LVKDKALSLEIAVNDFNLKISSIINIFSKKGVQFEQLLFGLNNFIALLLTQHFESFIS